MDSLYSLIHSILKRIKLISLELKRLNIKIFFIALRYAIFFYKRF